MKGKELKFTLNRLGLTYRHFSKLIGKSPDSIQRWISFDMNVGEIHLIPIRKNFSKQVLKQIESDWQIHLNERKRLEKEYIERCNAYYEEERLRSSS